MCFIISDLDSSRNSFKRGLLEVGEGKKMLENEKY
jgi:hypothetical protein